jgi:diguanylate cyclase
VADEAVVGPVPDHVWPMRSAAHAADALVELIERLAPAGWSFQPGMPTGRDLDLRTPDGIEPVPLVLPDGKIRGTVRHPVHPTGDPVDAVLRVLVQTVVLLVVQERRGWAAADRAQSAERASRIDPLTSLPNRREWDDALVQETARCRRHGLRALLAAIDLDGLKEANDTHGHLAGDMLLRMAAKALRSAVRETDLVARIGGDEFAVLAVEFEDGDPAAFAGRLGHALGRAGVVASIGAVVVEPGRDLANEYDRADHLMYDSKRARKATVLGSC